MLTNERINAKDLNQEVKRAKAEGYFFRITDDKWVLGKREKINVEKICCKLSEPARTGFRLALAYYASEKSASLTDNIAFYLNYMLDNTASSHIDAETLINFRHRLPPEKQYYIGSLKGFLKKWHDLGYPGVSKDVIKLLDGWRLKGNIKGDAVKRMNPKEGPLTDMELQAFNEGVVMAFEKGLISISDLAICLITSSTGRRPVQISHLRVADLMRGSNTKGEPYYVLNIPRGKQSGGLRDTFKPFAMTEELWGVVNSQVKHVIKSSEKILGFALPEKDKYQLPIFPDEQALQEVCSIDEYRDLTASDKLHISPAKVTETIQKAVDLAGIKSERTGEILTVNARRFRYTTGTRAAREGFGELVIAELLDHSDTQNAGVYIKNIPEHVKRLDEAVGFQLAPYAQAFAGVLVDSEKDAKRGEDPTSRVRTEEGCGIGTCGEHGFCGANVPIPCYTCMHFQPWLDGPHEEVYKHLLEERERLIEITGDLQVAATLDRSITAVADVIQRCKSRKEELASEQEVAQ